MNKGSKMRCAIFYGAQNDFWCIFYYYIRLFILDKIREKNTRTHKKNKAVYTAALVADGWEGAENLIKQLCDLRTDRPTDGPKSGL